MGRIIGAIAEARWLDAQGARIYRAMLLAIMLAGSLFWIATSRDGIDRAGHPLGTDFLAFWSAARLALAGLPADTYDLAKVYAVERASVAADPGAASFLYPPPFLLVCLPFGLMTYGAALAAWLVSTGAAWLAVARGWLGGGRGWPLTALAFPAVMIEIGNGQNGFLTAALLGGGSLLLDRRPWLAGLLFGALVVKPQLAFAVPVLVIASGRWRTMAAGIAGAGALGLASLAAFGPGVWHAFLAGNALGREILERGLVEPGKMASVYAAVRVIGGGTAQGYAAQAIVALVVASILALVCRRRDLPHGAAGALTIAATPLISPFLLDYDLVAIGFPLAWLWREGLRRGFRPYEKAILATGFAMPLFARVMALSAGLPIAPPVCLLLFVAIVRASDHRHATIDVQRLPGDVARLAAGEIGDRRADILARA